MAKETKTKALKCAAMMPALYHKLPDEEFDASKSEVLAWFAMQHDLLDAIFQLCNSRGAIVYDKETGKWRGKDHT